MKIGVCIKGLEDIAAGEVKGKKIAKGRVSFEGEVKDFKSLKLAYDLIGKFGFKTKSELIKNIKLDFNGSFTVMCNREGVHKFNSGWVMHELNKKFSNKTRKVDYKTPKTVIYVDIMNGKCFFGFLIKKDMHKRDYRVKLRGATVHPCVAYSMLNLIDYKKNERFLDPKCSDGVIAIEAALFGGKEIMAVDKNIRDARINSKIAKVNIEFSEGEIEIIKKFKKVKKIASYLPSASKMKREGMISRLYERFLESTRKVLNGKMVILIEKKNLLKMIAKKFKLIEERKIFVGDSVFYILVFE